MLLVDPEITHIPLLKADILSDPRRLCIRFAGIDAFLVHVMANKLHFDLRLDLGSRVASGLLPRIRGDARPKLRSKFPIQPWRHIPPDHRCFDQYCSRATHRVDQQAIFIPKTELNKGGCQSLFDRCPSGMLPISPTIQPCSGCVEG